MNIFNTIDIKTAIYKIDINHALVLDIRDKESFDSGHIDGALNLSNDNIDDFISNTKKDKSLIVYCYHGNSSQKAAEFLASHGFIDVYSLDGGYEEWKTKNIK